MSQHCTDCGYTWEGAAGLCPRCGSRRVRQMNRRQKGMRNLAIVAIALLLFLGGTLLLQAGKLGVPGRQARETPTAVLSVTALSVEPLRDNLYAIYVTVQNESGYPDQVSLQNWAFLLSDGARVYPEGVWPDGGEQESAYLPAGRSITLAGAAELPAGAERLTVSFETPAGTQTLTADVK